MSATRTIEVILRNDEKRVFHNVTFANIGNDGVLRIESGPKNIIAEFHSDAIAGWSYLE